MGVGAVKIKFDGISELSDQLEALAGQATEICKYGLYPAAGIIADEIRESTPKNSGDLAKSLTITKMRAKDGVVSLDVRFEGIDSKGAPNAVKARVLESGRSDQPGRVPKPFIKPAISRAKSRALEAMSKAVDEKINEIIKKNGG